MMVPYKDTDAENGESDQLRGQESDESFERHMNLVKQEFGASLNEYNSDASFRDSKERQVMMCHLTQLREELQSREREI